ncbi:MAG: hypothetical protein U0932_01095 [Thiobacillus sp.]|nr:hypothetical protein [Thiobacillus sp.]
MDKKAWREKLRAVFDSRVTWATIGTFSGMFFSEKITAGVNAFGVFVMAVL